MKFTENEIIKLRRFCQAIINNPRPFDNQPSQRDGIYLWCEDWEIIEVLKFMFLGREIYYADPPPNRLKNNHLWSQDEISRKAEDLMDRYRNVDNIIEFLKTERSRHDSNRIVTSRIA